MGAAACLTADCCANNGSRGTAAACHSASRRVRPKAAKAPRCANVCASSSRSSQRVATSATEANGARARRSASMRLRGVLAQAGDVAQAETKGECLVSVRSRSQRSQRLGNQRPETGHSDAFQRASPARTHHIDRQHPQAMPLRVLHQRRRVVEAERPVVEHGAGERREMMGAQVRRGVRQQREAGGVDSRGSRRGRTR